MKVCRRIVDPQQVFAACFYGPKIYGYNNNKADVSILLVLSDYSPKMNKISKKVDSTNLSILVIDKGVFEDDVKLGRFGELVAEIIALPYSPMINPNYLEEMEVEMKKRFILELLRNLVIQYPELSTELLIEPEYFMYEVIRRRVKLFPPLLYSFSNVFKKRVRKRNIDSMMAGYLKALDALETENCIMMSNSYVTIDKDFIEQTKRERNKFSNILMSVQQAVLPHIREFLSKITTTFWQDQSFFKKTPQQKSATKLLRQLEETEKHLLMPIPLGPISLSDKTSIQDFVRKTVPGGETLKIEIEELGGVLNSVFLLSLQKNHETQKIVVKKFEDWLGFKWFPLALWTLGTQSFAVLGKTRIEREYSINQFMSKHGFTVPKILYVSLKERLIFEEFVEGEKLSEIVKRLITAQSKKNVTSESSMIKRVGREIAKAHLQGIALGDCKPENILITKENQVCFLDLEQATRNGNQTWDIAEFLYYSGHYISPMHPDETARIIASSFIEGYLEAGGKKENVRKAASAKYTKIFSVFTLPHIILIMANICRKTGEEKNKK
ncbi:MAG: lipopolysaccharide kinase InaA family protein [Candidatus Bathyarchaeia archaeon]